MLRRQMITGFVMALIAVLLVAACGVTRGEEASGLHRLRMMVPNSPGGGYDLTARTAVKVMEDDDITGRIEVFNVIGAGGTVAMARLMNEKGNGDLMMMMGLGVVGATYTNGSKSRVSEATALAKMIEEPGALLFRRTRPSRRCRSSSRRGRPIRRSVTIGGGSSPGGPDHLFPMETAKAVGVDPTAVNFVSYDGGGDLLDRAARQEDHSGHVESRRIRRPDRVRPAAGARGVQRRASRRR